MEALGGLREPVASGEGGGDRGPEIGKKLLWGKEGWEKKPKGRPTRTQCRLPGKSGISFYHNLPNKGGRENQNTAEKGY